MRDFLTVDSVNEIELGSATRLPVPFDSNTAIQFSSLWHVARLHSTEDGHVVLLLVTSGYLELFTNFICSVRAYDPTFSAFLVITADEEVVEAARSFGIGFYRAHGLNLDAYSYNSTNGDNFADFGTISYQRLVLGRTEVAMELVKMAYKPIIADIDTVWLSNPLRFLNQPQSIAEGNYDVAITDDNGEVCGCFVALSNSEPAKLFWAEVLRYHRQLVAKGQLEKFTDSEQKILTELIYRKQYRREALFRLLPSKQFPSGLHYFNWHSELVDSDQEDGKVGNFSSPTVIHNNFLVGKDMKRTRFQRYGLWFAAENRNRSVGAEMCAADSLSPWRKYFEKASRDVRIPSLNIILPLHNAVTSSERNVMQVLREENIPEDDRKKGDLIVWVESDPPSYAEFSSSGIGQLIMGSSGLVTSVTACLFGTNIEVSVDIGVNRTHFAADFDGKAEVITAAHEKVQAIWAEHPLESEPQLVWNDENIKASGELSSDLTYVIKVLAYKRPESLMRLLDSLFAAEYGEQTDIALEIFVDYAKSAEVNLI